MTKFSRTIAVVLLLAAPCVPAAVAQVPAPTAPQTDPAPPAPPVPAPTTPAAAPAVPAKFTLDTPIVDLVADAKAKAVLEADLPGLTAHPRFGMFKRMSLNALSGFAPDKLTPERLAKVRSDLAVIQ